jgi:DNA-binding IclR family transcriptional regulator
MNVGLSPTAVREGLAVSELPQPARPSGGGRAPSVAQSMLRVLTLLAEHPDGVRASDVARSVLDVLTLLAERPDGVGADEVAERVGKSTSTAYYLLASLCEEGFAVRDGTGGRYRLRRAAVAAVPGVGDRGGDDLEAAVDALFLRTRKDCYLGRVQPGAIEVVAARGREGRPKIPGLDSPITEGLHALAMGKVVLSLLPDAARRRYVRGELRSFTDATITARDALMDELDEVRRSGVAIERGEFDLDFCCVAAPMRDARGRLVAALGLATTTCAFDAERDGLVEAVLDAAAMSQPVQKTHAMLRHEGLTP